MPQKGKTRKHLLSSPCIDSFLLISLLVVLQFSTALMRQSCCQVVWMGCKSSSLVGLVWKVYSILSPLSASMNNECVFRNGEKIKDIIRRSKASMSPITSPAAAVSNHFHSVSGSVKSPINFMTEVFITEGGDVKPPSECNCSETTF